MPPSHSVLLYAHATQMPLKRISVFGGKARATRTGEGTNPLAILGESPNVYRGLSKTLSNRLNGPSLKQRLGQFALKCRPAFVLH